MTLSKCLDLIDQASKSELQYLIHLPTQVEPYQAAQAQPWPILCWYYKYRPYRNFDVVRPWQILFFYWTGVTRIDSGIPQIDSYRWNSLSPGESYKCHGTHIKFNPKDIKGGLLNYHWPIGQVLEKGQVKSTWNHRACMRDLMKVEEAKGVLGS
jgi:hypothetical protein